jgi:hypothetical protein
MPKGKRKIAPPLQMEPAELRAQRLGTMAEEGENQLQQGALPARLRPSEAVGKWNKGEVATFGALQARGLVEAGAAVVYSDADLACDRARQERDRRRVEHESRARQRAALAAIGAKVPKKPTGPHQEGLPDAGRAQRILDQLSHKKKEAVRIVAAQNEPFGEKAIADSLQPSIDARTAGKWLDEFKEFKLVRRQSRNAGWVREPLALEVAKLIDANA